MIKNSIMPNRPDNELNSHELLERIVVERLEKTDYDYARVLGNLQGVLEAILVMEMILNTLKELNY